MYNKKGQAAIEFLVTYGWAIMAAMIVIAALTYFGVTNPATSLPDKCIFSNGFDCKDFRLTASQAQLQLTNGLGQTMFTLSSKTTENGVACTINGAASIGQLDPEETMSVVCSTLPNAPFNVREKGKVKVSINYLKTVGGYNQVSLGELYAIVQ
jgi:hypothetical protein